MNICAPSPIFLRWIRGNAGESGSPDRGCPTYWTGYLYYNWIFCSVHFSDIVIPTFTENREVINYETDEKNGNRRHVRRAGLRGNHGNPHPNAGNRRLHPSGRRGCDSVRHLFKSRRSVSGGGNGFGHACIWRFRLDGRSSS